jgi:ankyrin repeat protein
LLSVCSAAARSDATEEDKAAKKQQATTLVQHKTPNLSALLELAAHAKLQHVQQYLDAGGLPNATVVLIQRGKEITAPLLHAVAGSDHADVPESIALLCAAGAAVNAICMDHQRLPLTALLYATEICHSTRAVAALLAAGADPCQRIHRNSTTLHAAAAAGYLAKLDLMLVALQQGVDESRDAIGRTVLAIAAQSGQLAVVKRLHQLGADLNAADNYGNAALQMSAFDKHLAVMSYLLRNGADPNALNASGQTALFAAVSCGCAAAVQLLLEHGADETVRGKDGMNALYPAVRTGSLQAQVLGATAAGCTLLMQAALSDQLAVAEYLLAKGADVHAADHGGLTALHCAADDSSKAGLVRLLLAKGASVHAASDEGVQPLHTAAGTGSVAIAELLLAAGAHAAAPARFGGCLLIAASEGHAQMVQLLLRHGAAAVINDVFTVCNCCSQLTAVMACEEHTSLKVLLEAGADVRKRTADGDTCLHTAARHGRSAPVVCMLIKAGVDMSAVNDRNQTAAQVALERGNTLIAALLTRAAQTS